MEESGEQELVERCRSGSDEAFRELVDRYKNLVYGVILHTVADRSGVDDLAQEVFLRVHRGLPAFRGESSLDDNRRPLVTLGTPDRVFAGVELRDRLDKALAQLSPAARFLVSAHYLGGQKYEDLAQALDLPLGTVKTHLYRAKQRLRALLEREG
jgi:RNA polymerase sigma-70 factor, ECF subfamily